LKTVRNILNADGPKKPRGGRGMTGKLEFQVGIFYYFLIEGACNKFLGQTLFFFFKIFSIDQTR
jgi:hypothetical protein